MGRRDLPDSLLVEHRVSWDALIRGTRAKLPLLNRDGRGGVPSRYGRRREKWIPAWQIRNVLRGDAIHPAERRSVPTSANRASESLGTHTMTCKQRNRSTSKKGFPSLKFIAGKENRPTVSTRFDSSSLR